MDVELGHRQRLDGFGSISDGAASLGENAQGFWEPRAARREAGRARLSLGASSRRNQLPDTLTSGFWHPEL